MTKSVAVFGGSGFIGRYVVEALARAGMRLRIATRDPHRAQHLRPLAALGQLDFVPADITHAGSVARAVDAADAVVNLVGILDNADGGFTAIHVDGAATVAAASAARGAALVHMSALGADAQSDSAYASSKGEGDAAVRAAHSGAVVLRPSVVFGPEDQFLNRFAGLMRIAPVMPVIAAETRFQPVYVGDVARAVAATVAAPPTGKPEGDTFTLGGPEVISMRALLAWIAEETGRTPSFIDVPDGAARLFARLAGWLPGAPLTFDQWLMLQRDNVLGADDAGLDALGIKPTPMRAVAPRWLVRYRKAGRFSDAA